jgi:hypothetical protein
MLDIDTYLLPTLVIRFFAFHAGGEIADIVVSCSEGETDNATECRYLLEYAKVEDASMERKCIIK